eukprot:GHVP01035484.1.p1 GENE.GHVP01035484.1~~GHVP01035484.1.p1  ORF type:complete len:371 (+),score=59.61 GHVP01035484.1:131-1114(+)
MARESLASGTDRSRPFRIAFFDLDNTLIPTNWIMEKWRKNCNERTDGPEYRKITNQISRELQHSGVFHAIEMLFERISRDVDYISIVTNAGSFTLGGFYLQHCMPQLQSTLKKHSIPITSTDVWTSTLGSPPDNGNVDGFRRYYTEMKRRQFERETKEILAEISGNEKKLSFSSFFSSKQRDQSLTPSDQSTSASPAGSSSTTDIEFSDIQQDARCIEIISVGDQMCEISAACQVAKHNSKQISCAKLLLISGEDMVVAQQNPIFFSKHLDKLAVHVENLVNSQTSSDIGWRKAGPNYLHCVSDSVDVTEEGPLFTKGKKFSAKRIA